MQMQLFNNIKILSVFILVILLCSCRLLQTNTSTSAATRDQPAPIATIDEDHNQYYTVKQGESLYEVARKFNVTERAIIIWNDLDKPYTLKSGQVLALFAQDNEDVHNDEIINAQQADTTYDSAVFELNDDEIEDHSSVNGSEEQTDNRASSVQQSQQRSSTSRSEAKDHKTQRQPAQAKQKANTYRRQSHQGQYTVRSGDTLIGIARSFGLTLSNIAALNDIKPPYVIYEGQVLSVDKAQLNQSDSAKDTQKIEQNKQTPDSKPKEVTETSDAQSKQQPGTAPKDLQWQWPIDSATKVTADDTSVMLEGNRGQRIVASCQGDVIYSGVGVGGYGQMLIVECHDDYIAAYSNLLKTNVAEGDQVNRGDKIATLGKFHGHSMLGFQVRKDGTPVKLLDVLPKGINK